MSDTIKRIGDWNRERGLLEKGFNHQLEASFIIEEVLESFGFEKTKDVARAMVKDYAEFDSLSVNGVECIKTHEPIIPCPPWHSVKFQQPTQEYSLSSAEVHQQHSDEILQRGGRHE